MLLPNMPRGVTRLIGDAKTLDFIDWGDMRSIVSWNSTFKSSDVVSEKGDSCLNGTICLPFDDGDCVTLVGEMTVTEGLLLASRCAGVGMV